MNMGLSIYYVTIGIFRALFFPSSQHLYGFATQKKVCVIKI